MDTLITGLLYFWGIRTCGWGVVESYKNHNLPSSRFDSKCYFFWGSNSNWVVESNTLAFQSDNYKYICILFIYDSKSQRHITLPLFISRAGKKKQINPHLFKFRLSTSLPRHCHVRLSMASPHLPTQPSTRPSIHRRVRSYKMCTAPSIRYEIRSKWGLNDCRIDLPARLISVIQLYLAGGVVGKVSSSSLLHFLLHQLSERSQNSAHVSLGLYLFELLHLSTLHLPSSRVLFHLQCRMYSVEFTGWLHFM